MQMNISVIQCLWEEFIYLLLRVRVFSSVIMVAVIDSIIDDLLEQNYRNLSTLRLTWKLVKRNKFWAAEERCWDGWPARLLLTTANVSVSVLLLFPRHESYQDKELFDVIFRFQIQTILAAVSFFAKNRSTEALHTFIMYELHLL